MIVVNDTSCISNLLTVGQTQLLAKLFGEVITPPAVSTITWGSARRLASPQAVS